MNDAPGWRVQRFEDVASTNDEARRAALAGDPGDAWFVAERQSAGRGRHERPWVSPRGNLHASALLIDPCPVERGAEIGFVAGVALIDSLRAFGGRKARFALKWPNDVLVDGAKLAGILVEGMTLPNRRFAAIVGIGVNCASAPEGLAYPATSLTKALGEEIHAAALFDALHGTFAAALAHWARGENFAGIRQLWLERAVKLGAAMSVKRGAEARDGVFDGLDASGRLRLKRADGAVELIEAGDVALASA